MSRERLAVCLAMLLSCAGCGSRDAGVPASPAAPLPHPENATSSEPASDTSAAISLPEEPPASPAQPAEESTAEPAPTSTAPSEAPGQPATKAESTEPPAATTELLHDSFADAAGSIRWNRDGARSFEGPASNRTIYFFNGMPEGGPLVMRVVEDGTILGPDGEPGVLALSWQEIPPKLPYSGFVYLGGRENADRMTLPPLKLARTVDDLRPIRLKFRYKAASEGRQEPFSLRVGCRLEPMLAESYARRIDLGTFTATNEWGSFEMSLAEGKNVEAFLATIANENPATFKVIWSHAGALADYRAGDTLLIDDIVITSWMAE